MASVSAAGYLPNVTLPFGSKLPDTRDSGPGQGVAFIAAMVPTRMPVMPAGASQPGAGSPRRRLYAAWTYFKVGVLYAFYKRFHRIWTTAFEDITSAELYYFRMPRLGNLVDQYLFHNALGVNKDSLQTARLRLNAQTQKKMDRLVGEIGIDVIDAPPTKFGIYLIHLSPTKRLAAKLRSDG